MQKTLIGGIVAIGLTTAALAQTSGSTYPAGSNLPQRTAGETAPKPDGSASGSGGPNTSHHVQGKAASKHGAKPRHRARTPH